MASPEIKINVGDLDAGGKHFQFPLRAAWIRGILEDHEATAAGPDGQLDVRASRSGNDVVIHGTLRAALQVPCARCLCDVSLPIDQTLSLLFVPGKVGMPPVVPKEVAKSARAKRDGREVKAAARKRAELEEVEISSEDADTLAYEGEVIVLDDVIRDELILETPIFPLCSEDCAGMSPPPGDPRGPTANNTETGRSKENGDEPAPPEAGIDPRLLPLLRLRTKRD